MKLQTRLKKKPGKVMKFSIGHSEELTGLILGNPHDIRQTEEWTRI